MNYFKKMRQSAKISRVVAAEELGISWFHLRNIENDQRLPSKSLILRMCELYGVNTTDMLKESQKILLHNYSK